MPGSGKTALACKLVAYLLGDDTSRMCLVDFPEEEGTGTVSDMDIPFATVATPDDLESAYLDVLKMQPRGIIMDGLPSAWRMFLFNRCPGGNMPEDHGKTWRALANDLILMITKFKMIPSVEWFAATSLVWPDEDEITQAKGRMQATLPGQLKGNIYGLFSYAFNIRVAEAQGKTVHILETQPTAKVVAKMRVPIGTPVPATVLYDLADAKSGVSYLTTQLKLVRKESSNE